MQVEIRYPVQMSLLTVLLLVQQLLQMEVTVLTLDQVRSVAKLLRLPHLTLDILVKP
jgi:hypothetical protein